MVQCGFGEHAGTQEVRGVRIWDVYLRDNKIENQQNDEHGSPRLPVAAVARHKE